MVHQEYTSISTSKNITMNDLHFSKTLYSAVFGFTLLLMACSDKDADNKPQVIQAAGNI
jgi:hypothetical protein